MIGSKVVNDYVSGPIRSEIIIPATELMVTSEMKIWKKPRNWSARWSSKLIQLNHFAEHQYVPGEGGREKGERGQLTIVGGNHVNSWFSKSSQRSKQWGEKWTLYMQDLTAKYRSLWRLWGKYHTPSKTACSMRAKLAHPFHALF